MSDGTKKRDPKKWAEAKAGLAEDGQPRSSYAARREYYKDAGGTYEGKKSKTTSSLSGARGLADQRGYEKKEKK